jgi:hypothetical protein
MSLRTGRTTTADGAMQVILYPVEDDPVIVE